MTKKEKVIDGLIHCGVKECCGDCSYCDPEDDDREVVQCIKQLCRDALDLITTPSVAEIGPAIADADIPEGVSEAQVLLNPGPHIWSTHEPVRDRTRNGR